MLSSFFFAQTFSFFLLLLYLFATFTIIAFLSSIFCSSTSAAAAGAAVILAKLKEIKKILHLFSIDYKLIFSTDIENTNHYKMPIKTNWWTLLKVFLIFASSFFIGFVFFFNFFLSFLSFFFLFFFFLFLFLVFIYFSVHLAIFFFFFFFVKEQRFFWAERRINSDYICAINFSKHFSLQFFKLKFIVEI